MAQTFIAKFRGRCSSESCDRPIEPGDDIVRVDQELFHDGCALGEGSAPAPAARRVCTDCFVEVSVSGACSC